MTQVVILGAGHAGGSCAAFLRQFGFEGDITLVGEEPHLPYQRPPLSKARLKDEPGSDSVTLRPAEFYAQSNITMRMGRRALEISNGQVLLDDGSHLPFDKLVFATGATPRALSIPGADLPGVLAVRSVADADALRRRLSPGRSLVIIGGGYVGLEVAASANSLGCEVIVVERESRLLARVASPPVSDFFKAAHRAHGVRILLGTEVESIIAGADGAAGVRLRGGPDLFGETVVVGIGAIPNDALARPLGLCCEGGISVDLDGRTGRSDVFAIGDVTVRPLPHYGINARIESVANALEQARRTAAAIAGAPTPPDEVPWFWSDQYKHKLQIAGVARPGQHHVIRRPDGDGRLTVFHLEGTRLRSVEAINMVAEFMGGRQLIAGHREVDPAKLADPSVPMKATVVG